MIGSSFTYTSFAGAFFKGAFFTNTSFTGSSSMLISGQLGMFLSARLTNFSNTSLPKSGRGISFPIRCIDARVPTAVPTPGNSRVPMLALKMVHSALDTLMPPGVLNLTTFKY
ncbi:MAG: pentapeptide repeat-containing protein [Nitrospirae bacterium]|nr:pentapeptide repeat-containing protein [Nitrospirota bacterium]